MYAYPIVEKTGLCNMFYPWARAVVWARENESRVIAPNWVQFGRVGVWLRHERDKRTYLRQFSNAGYVSGLKKWWLLKTHTRSSERDASRSGIVIFKGREEFGWMEPVKNERIFLTCELERIVNPKIIFKLSELPREYIAVHIRKGDFKLGDEQQPDTYYLSAIAQARKDVGDKPILVFSDGDDKDLEFLRHEKVRIMRGNPAVYDVLALSRSTVLVGTNHSTFSYWGAFLGRDKVSYWSRLKHKAMLPDTCEVRYV